MRDLHQDSNSNLFIGRIIATKKIHKRIPIKHKHNIGNTGAAD